MSLNRTLDRLFDEIRREAKRNPEFADRLDAVLRTHISRRDIGDLEDVEAELQFSAQGETPTGAEPDPAPKVTPEASPAAKERANGASHAPALNPAGFYKREGEAALEAALSGLGEAELRALIVEHNLDPSGAAGALDREGVAAHILAQAKRRAERDDKMFDY